MKKEHHQDSDLSLSRFHAIVESIDSLRDRLLLLTLFETGCSVGDLCAITVKDIRQPPTHTQLFTIRFHGPDRDSAISEGLHAGLTRFALQRQRKGDEYLFSQQPRKAFSMKRVEQVLAAISAENSVELTPLAIKHLHIMQAVKCGLSAATIASQTGLTPQRVLHVCALLHLRNPQSYTAFFGMPEGRNHELANP